MNPVAALKLLDLFQQHADIKSKSLLGEAHRLFVVPFWSDTAVLRDSWVGKIAVCLQRPSEKTQNTEKISRCFAQALNAVGSKPSRVVPFQTCIKLHQELSAKKMISTSQTLDPTLTSTPEIEEMAQAKKAKKKDEWSEMKRLSLLREPSSSQGAPDEKLMQMLFGGDWLPIDQRLDRLENLLNEQPQYAVPDWKNKLGGIRQALAQDQKFKEAVLPEGKPLTPEVIEKRVMDLGTELSSAVRALPARQKQLLPFGYGLKSFDLRSLVSMAHHLPAYVFNELPKEIRNFLQKNHNSDPKAFAKELIHSFFAELTKEVSSQDSSKGEPINLKPLLGSSDLEIPEYVALAMPKILEAYLENILKKGVIGNLAAVIPDPRAQVALSWIQNEAEYLSRLQKPEELVTLFEGKLQKLVDTHFDKVTGGLTKKIDDATGNMKSLLMPELVELLGWDHFLLGGPIWIEVEKSDKGTYDLAIFGLGPAKKYHPQNSKQQRSPVMRLTGVHPDRLTPDFFQALLRKHLEPYWNPKAVSKVGDIYEGPLATLEGNVVPCQPDDPTDPEDGSTVWDMIWMQLFKQQNSQTPLRFELEWKTLLAFCRSHLKNGELVFADQKSSQIVSQAVQKLTSEVKQLKKDPLQRELAIRMKATLKEIDRAINKFEKMPRPSLDFFAGYISFDVDMKKGIKEILIKLNVSRGKLEALKDNIEWALGEEVGELIDYILDHYEEFLPGTEEVKKVATDPTSISKQNSDSSFLGSFYLGIYLQLAYKVARIVVALVGLYTGGLGHLLELPLLMSILPHILPAPILEWYQRVLDFLKRWISNLAVQTTIHWLLDEQGREKLKEAGRQFREVALNSKQFLATSKPLSFELSDPFPFESTAPSSRSVPIQIKPQLLMMPVQSIQGPFGIIYESEAPFPNRQQPIDSKDLLAGIKEWNQQIPLMRNEKKLDYLLGQIDRLDIPSHKTSSTWDTVDKPEELLEQLSELSNQLLGINEDARRYNIYKFGRVSAASYKLLAIMDCLARRSKNAKLEGLRINAYPLLSWFRGKGVILDDPLALEQLKKTAAYLLPDIDLNNIPSEKELQKQSAKTLFHYTIKEGGTFSEGIEHQFTKSISSAEIGYYDEILKDPSMNERFKRLGFDKLTFEQKRLILFHESFTMTRKPSFFPRSFLLLRLQNLLCIQLARKGIYDISYKKAFDAMKNNPPPEYPNDPDKIETTFVPVGRSGIGIPVISQNFSDRLPWLRTEDMAWHLRDVFYASPLMARVRYFQPIGNDHLKIGDARPQSEIIREPLPEKTMAVGSKLQSIQEKLYEMAYCEESEQIIQLLNFIRNNPDLSHSHLNDILKALELALFQPNALWRRVKESPQIIQAIGKTFDFLLKQSFDDSKFHVIDLGLRVKNYCEEISPGSSRHLPDFKQILQSMPPYKWGEEKERIRTALLFLAHPPLKPTQTPAEQQKAVTALFQALLQRPFDEKNQEVDSGFMYRGSVMARFEERFWQSKHALNALDPNTLNEFLDPLVGESIWSPKTTAKQERWVKGIGLRYRKGNLEIDFATGVLKGGYFIAELLNELRNNPLVKDSLGWEVAFLKQGIEKNTFESSSGNFKIVLKDDGPENYFEIKIFLKHEGADYKYVRNEEIEPLIQSATDPRVSCWVEETPSTYKKVLVSQNEGKYNLAGKCNFENLSVTVEDPPNKPSLKIVSEQEVNNHLFSLSKFCRLDSIRAFAREGEKYLHSFNLKEQYLHFDVKPDSQGVLRAWSSDPKLASFYINERNHHPALEGIGSYLILENSHGRKKVLILKDSWKNCIVWRGLSLLGPLASKFQDITASLFASSKSYYIFDLEAVGEGQSPLSSKDPEALVFLMTAYFLQGKKELANEVFKKFQWLCNIKTVPPSIWEAIALLAYIPIDIDGIRDFRLKIFATLAQNQMIPKTDEKKPKPQESKDLNSNDIIIAWSILWDLHLNIQNAEPRQTLKPYEEYFLFQMAFEKLSVQLRNQMPSRDRPEKMAKFAVDNIDLSTLVELFGLAPDLSARFQAIKKQLGLQDSRARKVAKWIGKFIQTPSSIPEALFFPEGGINPSLPFDQTNLLDFVLKIKHFVKTLECDYRKFYDQMENRIETNPILDPKKLTPEILRTQFITYYAIAKGDWKGDNSDIPPPRQELDRMLKILKGCWDPDSCALMEALEAVLADPEGFSSTDHFLDIRHPPKSWSGPVLKISDLELSNREDEWNSFFRNLKTVSMMTFACKKISDPIFSQIITEGTADTWVSTVGNRLLPYNAFANPFLRYGANLASGSAEFALQRKARNFTKDKAQGMRLSPYLIPFFNSDRNWKDIGKKVANLAGFVFGTALTVKAANDCLNKALPSLPRVSMGEIPSLKGKTFLQGLAFAGMLYGGNAFMRIALAKIFKHCVPLESIVPFPGFTLPALNLLSKTYNTYRNEAAAKEKVQAASKALTVKYSVLEAEDMAIDEFLEKQFDLAFTEQVKSDEKAQEDPTTFMQFEIKESDPPLLQERYRRVNLSLQNYYEKEGRVPPSFAIHDEASLYQIYFNLKGFTLALRKQLENEKSQLLSLFNTETGKNVKPLSLLDIHRFVEARSMGKICKEVGLEDSHLPQVALALGRIDHKNARLNQIETMVSLLQEQSNYSQDAPPRLEKLEQLAILLQTRTAFNLKHSDSKMIRHFLRFQAGAKTMLREQQAKNREAAVSHSGRGVMTEEIPGSGKTFFGNPFTIEYESDSSDKMESIDDKQTVLALFPKQIAGDNMPTIHEQMQSIFGKPTHVLHANRQLNLDMKALEALMVMLQGARQAGEPYQATKEHAQAIQSILIERMWHYRRTPGRKTPENKNVIILLRKIWKLIGGIAIPDEGHETYSYRHHLSYPLGSSRRIEKAYFGAAESCFRLLTRDPILGPLMQTNKLVNVDKKHFHNVIKPKIAETMSGPWYFKVKDEVKRKELIAFLCDYSMAAPKWIKANAALYNEASLVRGILHTLLPMNFNSRVHEKYGASKKGKVQYAKPSDGNSHTVEEDDIQVPYEALAKTFLTVLSSGLNKEQGLLFLKQMNDLAYRERSKFKISYEQTLVYKKFGNILPKAILDKLYSMTADSPEFEEIYEKISRHPDACLLYTRYNIWKQIHFYDLEIRNTSMDFAQMFKKQLSCTGTPYNDGTYPAWMRMLRDPTTIGEALHIISQKCPPDGIHVLNSDQPKDAVEEVLQRFFNKDSTFCEVTDGGAMFTGLENEQVAKMILEFCKKYRPDIKGVKYYGEDAEGNECVKVIRVDGGSEMPSPEECITYYDQRHGFGANNPLKADGIETLGPNHPLYRWIQEVFRLRGLTKQQRLKAIEALLVKMSAQKIHFVMTQEVMEKIMDRDPENPAPRPFNIPTLQDIVDYAIRHETAIAEQENYPAMCQQYTAVAKGAIWQKYREVDDEAFDEFMGIFDEFETTLVTKLEHDPAKLFGLAKKEVSSEVALADARMRAFNIVKDSSTFSNVEKNAIRKEMKVMPVATMPTKVSIYQKEDGTFVDALQAVGAELTMEQTEEQMTEIQSDQDQQQESENENQLNVEQQSNVQSQFWNPRFTEWAWPTITNPASKEWLQFSNPKFQTSYSAVHRAYNWLRGKPTAVCPFFKVRDLAACAADRAIAEIASHLDDRLWMPNNFLPRWTRGVTESSEDLGSKRQFDLFQVLIHITKDENGKIKILNMGPLSLQDAALWRRKLSDNSLDWSKEPIKTVLWDLSSETVQAGYQLDTKTFVQSSDYKILTGQLKLLNGDVHYPNAREELTAWFKEHNPHVFHDAFKSIHVQRGKEDMHGKDIDHIFMDACDFPYEELM